MRLKVFLLLSLAWYGYLLYLGFSYLEWDLELYQEFMRVGWDKYEGPSLATPENHYFGVWLLSTLVSTILVFAVPTEKNVMVLCFAAINFLLLISYIILQVADGDFSLQETQILWIVSALIELIGHGILLIEKPLTKRIRQQPSSLFLGYTLASFCLIGVGFYYWQWDIALVTEKARLGNIHHNNSMIPEGRAVKVPELQYHLMLAFTSLLALALVYLVQLRSKLLTVLKVLFFILLLYSMVVYANGYSFTMEETVGWWVGLCSVIGLLSGVLFWTTRKPVDDLGPVYEDDLLDDFSKFGE